MNSPSFSAWSQRRLSCLLLALLVVDRCIVWLHGGSGTGLLEMITHSVGVGGIGVLFAGHCDTYEGPVVTLGRQALDGGNVNLVLPWVRPEDEGEIRHAFQHAQEVRRLGTEARELADRFFLETLVRVHRAGEGAPFTGLKHAEDTGPTIPAADQALEDGSISKVWTLLSDALHAGLHQRFERAAARKHYAVGDVPAGRAYVSAYVPYIHYVEALWDLARGAAPAHHGEHEHGAQHPHSHGEGA
ncbi:hypothetical protein GWC77_21505 [Paraburkholderia sp. NMBU_R16]|uniref:DUF6448 family protein n=1 Tax=Paraburkholderia sp. NMBU_R16 TaxID=2698676 RepID=UPI001565522B|nr:DUF6448 family protein [Paraburkholderia sp. NMBU_R16]NRO98504.1 hypothetical protein [Paraburkholderia sp. NMBU_R16]